MALKSVIFTGTLSPAILSALCSHITNAGCRTQYLAKQQSRNLYQCKLATLWVKRILEPKKRRRIFEAIQADFKLDAVGSGNAGRNIWLAFAKNDFILVIFYQQKGGCNY